MVLSILGVEILFLSWDRISFALMDRLFRSIMPQALCLDLLLISTKYGLVELILFPTEIMGHDSELGKHEIVIMHLLKGVDEIVD